MIENVVRRIRNLIGFMTIFPAGISLEAIKEVAQDIFLFPIIGAIIGFLAGAFALIMMQIMPKTVAGMLTCGFILLITGLHHTDGLLDFGDGLMVHGSPEKKIKVMRDPHVGVGGVALGIIVIFSTALCISQLNQEIVLQSLIVSEVYAKFSMVALTKFGKSASEGLNTYFINAMQGKNGIIRLIAALLISLAFSLPLLRMKGLIAVASAITATLIVLFLSNRHFKGITGDVIGATNEITRLATLLLIVSLNFMKFDY